jgi:AraC family transcriptional regulator
MLDNILYFINSSYNKEIDLNLLAEEANYSPYHFHRLFKIKTGEAPKQYIQRLRLERACKELIFYPRKSIYEISIDCGFSSPSVFARAFKKMFATSAEEYRNRELKKINNHLEAINTPEVEVVRVEQFMMLSEMVLLDDCNNIIEAFKRINRWLKARNLLSDRALYCGAWLDSPVSTALRNCRYLAGICVPKAIEVKGKELLTLGGAMFARIDVSGDMNVLSDRAIKVKNKWLEENSFKVKHGVQGFEQFEFVDFEKDYSEQHRKLFIAIEPE